jgi:hypothetical protein
MPEEAIEYQLEESIKPEECNSSNNIRKKVVAVYLSNLGMNLYLSHFDEETKFTKKEQIGMLGEIFRLRSSRNPLF